MAILQAGSSIICSGWILAPLLGSIDDRGIGAHIGTFLFALSTTGFVTTLVALFQRRKHLWSLGMADSFAACTFPFSNTAIAAGLYQTAHFASGHSLAVWVLFLSILASALTIIVNFFFFWSIFYVLMPVNEFEPTLPLRGQETVVSVVISCADSQDNGSGSKKRSYEQDQ